MDKHKGSGSYLPGFKSAVLQSVSPLRLYYSIYTIRIYSVLIKYHCFGIICEKSFYKSAQFSLHVTEINMSHAKAKGRAQTYKCSSCALQGERLDFGVVLVPFWIYSLISWFSSSLSVHLLTTVFVSSKSEGSFFYCIYFLPVFKFPPKKLIFKILSGF